MCVCVCVIVNLGQFRVSLVHTCGSLSVCLQDMSFQQEELSVLRMEAQDLRDRQVESSRQQKELEAELQQLREELTRQITLGQVNLCDLAMKGAEMCQRR